MFGPGTTAAAIDAFERRFTHAAGAHFMIAANGKEAYPISEAESLSFRAIYRRRMERARRLRRGALLAVVPLLWLLAQLAHDPPGRMGPAWQAAYLLVMMGLPLFGLIQHPITSDLTKTGIERRLKRRITTRHPPAVTPPATPLGRFAKRLLIAALAIEVAIQLFHAFAGRDELAAHMRVLYGLQSGDESWTARLTGHLSSAILLCVVAGAALLAIDRRNRRAADAAKAAKADGQAS